MHRSTFLVILVLSGLAGLLGWNYFARPFAQPPQLDLSLASPQPSPAPQPQTAFEGWLQTASSREKVAQLIAYPVTITTRTNTASLSAQLTELQPGFITWFGEGISVASVSAMRDQVLAAYPFSANQPIFAVDHEGGRVQRLSGKGFSRLPSWREQCAQSGTEIITSVASSAAELQQVGVSVVFAPMLDVASSSAVLGNRLCSGDREVVVERARAWAGVFANQGILPVFKHFPGIGKTSRDLHTSFDRVLIEPSDALMYRRLLDAFPAAGVMVSHVGVQNQFPDLPCSLSKSCIDQLTGTYPEVLVFSDALEMDAASYQPSGAELPLTEVARRAIEAGNQVLVFGPAVTPDQLRAVIDNLTIAYDTNLTVKQQIDKALITIADFRARKEALP